jgi:hypothetical protein
METRVIPVMRVKFSEEVDTTPYDEFMREMTASRLSQSLSIPMALNTMMDHHLKSIVYKLRRHFLIMDEIVTKEIIYVYMTLENVYFFSENVGLYEVGTDFVMYLDQKHPDMITDNNFMLSYLLVCLVITQKYFVDNPLDNASVCHLFGFEVSKMNQLEMEVLSRLSFRLPYTLGQVYPHP